MIMIINNRAIKICQMMNIPHPRCILALDGEVNILYQELFKLNNNYYLGRKWVK